MTDKGSNGTMTASSHQSISILAVILLTTLGACAQGPAPTNGNSTSAAAANQYTFKCSDHPSLNDWAEELNAIKPMPGAGTPLHVLLPLATGTDKVSQCMRAMYEARVEAMRRSGLFPSVEVLEDPTPGLRPDTSMEDYWVWIDGYTMVASYGNGVRSNLLYNNQKLDGWVGGLPRFLKGLKDQANKTSPNISVTGIGANSYYGYQGREYIAYEDIRPALANTAKAFVDGTHPDHRQGQRVLIVHPSESDVIADNVRRLSLGKMDPTGSFGKIAGAGSYSWLHAKAEAIRKAGLFAQTTVEEKNLSAAPDGNYDALIWTATADASKWHVQARNGQPIMLPAQSGEDGDHWIASVKDALARSKAPAAGAQSAGPTATTLSAVPVTETPSSVAPAKPWSQDIFDLVNVYLDACVSKFPDDQAVGRRMTELQATAMTQDQISQILKNDPGVGWIYDHNGRQYKITLEAPPYHACAVRSLYRDSPNYRPIFEGSTQVWARDLRHTILQKQQPVTNSINGLTIVATSYIVPGQFEGQMEQLLTVETTYQNGTIEVRLVHQIAQ
jgi:hypothetical protein